MHIRPNGILLAANCCHDAKLTTLLSRLSHDIDHRPVMSFQKMKRVATIQILLHEYDRLSAQGAFDFESLLASEVGIGICYHLWRFIGILEMRKIENAISGPRCGDHLGRIMSGSSMRKERLLRDGVESWCQGRIYEMM